MSFEKDDFWDIEKLIPKKKSNVSAFSTKEKTVDYVVDGEVSEKKSDKTVLTSLRDREESSLQTYTYDSGFVRSVTITRFVDKYDFYGNFRKAALVYYDFKTPQCEFVHFYSYMPQYSQFNSEQKRFYFYWRDCVRKKKYIKTDYSYVLLYVYEILNLPDKIPANDGVEMLIEIWRAYRKDFPNIDSCMSLWLQDYCLIYNLPCPTEKISDFIFEVIGISEFKEFYLSDACLMGNKGVEAMIAYLSYYDWRQGRYAGGEGREIYSKHMIGAMSMLLSKLWNNGDIANLARETSCITRNAFRNSLCTHSVKCRLDIEYIPISASESIRHYVTAAVKYTENKLRALLGVKSRLAVKDLPEEYKEIIDFYFEDKFKKIQRERMKATLPEYEKLYDADISELSLVGADEIERLSWSTTARLVSDEEELDSAKEEFEPIPREAEPESNSEAYGLSKNDIDFIRALLSSEYSFAEKLYKESGELEEVIVERINEAFYDNFGDVIIEGSSHEFYIIEDYKEDIEKWLLKITK